MIAFGQHHHVAVAEDVLDDGGVDEHGGVVFFVGAGHKVEQSRGRRPEDEYLPLVECRIEAVLGHVVVGEVLEGAVDVGGVVTALVVDEEFAGPVDGDALHVAKTQFFAGLEPVDDGVGCGLNVADDVVREDDVVRIPLVGGFVVADIQVHGKVDWVVYRHACNGIAEELDGAQDIRGNDSFFVFLVVVQEESPVAVFVVLERDVPAQVEFFFWFQVFQRLERELHERLGKPRCKELPFENFKREIAFFGFRDNYLGRNVDELFLVRFDTACELELVVEREEHRVAESRICRVVAPTGVPVYAERLAEVDVLAQLDDYVFGLLVEQVQDSHERHCRIDMRRDIGVEFRVGEPVEQRYAAHHAVFVGVGVDGADLCRSLGQFGEDVVEEIFGFDVVGRVGLVEAECGAVAQRIGAFGRAEWPPLGLVLVRFAFIKHQARYGVPAFFDGFDK